MCHGNMSRGLFAQTLFNRFLLNSLLGLLSRQHCQNREVRPVYYVVLFSQKYGNRNSCIRISTLNLGGTLLSKVR